MDDVGRCRASGRREGGRRPPTAGGPAAAGSGRRRAPSGGRDRNDTMYVDELEIVDRRAATSRIAATACPTPVRGPASGPTSKATRNGSMGRPRLAVDARNAARRRRLPCPAFTGPTPKDCQHASRVHHRYHRPGRPAPRRVPARQGLRGVRHGQGPEQPADDDDARRVPVRRAGARRPRRPAVAGEGARARRSPTRSTTSAPSRSSR